MCIFRCIFDLKLRPHKEHSGQGVLREDGLGVGVGVGEVLSVGKNLGVGESLGVSVGGDCVHVGLLLGGGFGTRLEVDFAGAPRLWLAGAGALGTRF